MSDRHQLEKDLQFIKEHIEYVEKETFVLLRDNMIDDTKLYDIIYKINQKMHDIRKITDR